MSTEIEIDADLGGGSGVLLEDYDADEFGMNATLAPVMSKSSHNIRHHSLAYIPHITGALSVIGSAYIIFDVIFKKRLAADPKRRTYHRLILGLSITDLIASIAMFFSTWPIPQDSPSGEYSASGTIATCDTQGFFIQLGGVSSPIYNAFLAVYYFLVVKYGYKQSDFIKLERIFHVLPWLIGITTATASLVLQQYNSANLWCWIAPTPLDCIDSLRSSDGTTTCVRGDNAWFYRLVFYFIWLWGSVICVTVCTLGVLYTVVVHVRKLNRRRHSHTNTSADRHIYDVARQSVFYVGAFFITALFPSLVRMFQAKWNCTTTYFPLSVMTATFFPLQGLWNMLIYIQPRIKEAGAAKRRASRELQRRKSREFERGMHRKTSDEDLVEQMGRTTKCTATDGGSSAGFSLRSSFAGSYFFTNLNDENGGVGGSSTSATTNNKPSLIRRIFGGRSSSLEDGAGADASRGVSSTTNRRQRPATSGFFSSDTSAFGGSNRSLGSRSNSSRSFSAPMETLAAAAGVPSTTFVSSDNGSDDEEVCQIKFPFDCKSETEEAQQQQVQSNNNNSSAKEEEVETEENS